MKGKPQGTLTVGDMVRLRGDSSGELLTVVTDEVGSQVGRPWVTVGWFTAEREYRTAVVPVGALARKF